MATHSATNHPKSCRSDLTCAFVGLLVALLVIVAADVITTDVILAHGGVEVSAQIRAMQQQMGLPIWSIAWLGIHVAIAAFGATLWFVSRWLQRDSTESMWLLWAPRLLFIVPLLLWDVFDLVGVCQNILVLLRVG